MDIDDFDIDFNWNDDQFNVDDYFEQPITARNQRYSNAYGDYSGGYGPPGGFGPGRGGFGPGRGGFGPGRGGFGPGRGGFGPGRGGPAPRPGGPGHGRGGFGPGHRGVRPGPDGFYPPPLMYPPRSPRPLFMWGTGFGPQVSPKKKMPRDDAALRLLARCGVAKENLRNLPRDLLQLIGPQFCGLCGHSFTSFSVSRLHYASKNHLKNQRKFIAQKCEAGYKNTEIPLKARELYCELCDVHITSKSHADLHYGGRPHQAVVDGRKLPKNVKLLQDHMKFRLEQLIRREKKFVKTLEEKQVEVVVAKPIDSELYCEICKTEVTCSDQMTMHLNGKRHLTKEKRHILDMMTGAGGGAKQANNGDDIDAEQDAEVADVEQDAEVADAEQDAEVAVDEQDAEVADDEQDAEVADADQYAEADEATGAFAGADGNDDWPSGENEF